FSSLPLPLSHSLLLPYTTLFRSAPTWGNFLASISIAMVTYTGIETISNLSEEAKDPGRNVPLATWWVIVAVLFVSAFLPTIGVRDRKSTRLNSSHEWISYAVFCL